jgi:hypothetical protein
MCYSIVIFSIINQSFIFECKNTELPNSLTNITMSQLKKKLSSMAISIKWLIYTSNNSNNEKESTDTINLQTI